MQTSSGVNQEYVKIEVKIGRTEGFVSTLNLFVDDSLRLQTPLMVFMPAAERIMVIQKFKDIVGNLQSAGFEVTGAEALDKLITS